MPSCRGDTQGWSAELSFHRVKWLGAALVASWMGFGCGAQDVPVEPAVEPLAACGPESRRCWESVAQICGADGQWQNAEACAVACEAGACVGACGEGEARCDGGVAQRCEAGRWENAEACAVACEAGVCVAACDDGARRCDGQVAQRCEGGLWANDEVCPFACGEGACTGTCEDGSLRCDALQPQRCEGGAWVGEGDACPFGCAAGACTGTCEAGATRCWDDVVQRCDAEGTWQNEESCPFVCVDGACGGECADGSARCDGLQAQRCVEGFWQPDGEPCTFGCSAGACTGVCISGERRCAGDSLQRCDEDGAWQTSEICPFACANGACGGTCVPGALQCTGNAVQYCDERGGWQTVQTCAAGCTGSACTPVCTPDATQCYGGVLQRCDSGGQWANETACALGCSAGACLECTAGETTCSAGGVSACAAGFWDAPVACASGSCAGGACVDAPPSCTGGGDGLSNCGPTGTESCCATALVPGGSFVQDNDPRYAATVSSFRLDTYEITVGRFRRFVEAMAAGWMPRPGDGKHAHLAGGLGLEERGAAGTYETGWDPTWPLPADWPAAFASGWSCNWTDQPGAGENKAMNCLHWQEAYAFCIWDGGFLPSEAEWNFAAAGGDEQRLYPWGSDDPESGDYAMHSEACAGGWCMAPDVVGTKPLGRARWGQFDLAANAGEWVLDWYEDPYPSGAPCVDCVNLSSTRTMRGLRGGAHWDPPNEMISTETRYYGSPAPITRWAGEP